jgi:hypothetical protein
MSSVRGTISVDVAFTDSTTVSGAQSIKTIVLRDATEYTSGQVAIVTGTVGTAAVVVQTQPTTYKNAAGEFVSFSNVSRIAFAATGKRLNCSDVNETYIESVDGYVAATLVNLPGGDTFVVSPAVTAGTASYTLVLYGT